MVTTAAVMSRNKEMVFYLKHNHDVFVIKSLSLYLQTISIFLLIISEVLIPPNSPNRPLTLCPTTGKRLMKAEGEKTPEPTPPPSPKSMMTIDETSMMNRHNENLNIPTLIKVCKFNHFFLICILRCNK